MGADGGGCIGRIIKKSNRLLITKTKTKMKATIKTKISKTIQEEFEVKLPCFVRTDYHFYKIYSEEKAICVYLSKDASISVMSVNVPFAMDWRYCDAEDFASAFENAIAVIENGAYSEARQEVEDDSN